MSEPEANIKDEVRRRVLTQRAALNLPRRRRLDRRIGAHILRFLEDRDYLNLAGFHPFRGEPDLMPVLDLLHQAGRRIYLPVLDAAPGRMHFHRWQPGAVMRPNRFGIPEPVDGAPCPTSQLELVFTPLVAFSPTGTRLGMGAGYYDRSFADNARWPDAGPMLIGVAYALQEVNSLPAESWDVPLSAAITERGLQVFRNL